MNKMQTLTINGTKYEITDEKARMLLSEILIETGGNNLFDKNAEGISFDVYCKHNSGAEVATVGYFASDFIPVEVNKTYTTLVNARYFGNSNASRIPCFDENKTYIGYVTGGIIDGSDPTAAVLNLTIAEGHTSSGITDINLIKYIRLSYMMSAIDTFMMVEGTIYPATYEEFGKDRGIPSDMVFSPLKGKIISFIGDSICAGASSIPGGYGKIIANRCGMTYENLGVHGGTITAEVYRDDNTPRFWISRAVENMRADADYAIFEGGVNDASLNVPLGSITSDYTSELDDTTFAGAFESMLKQAVNRFAGKKIGYIFVHKMSSRFLSTDELGEVETHYTIAKKCCEKWGVPYLDLNAHCPLSKYVEALKDTYTNNQDGWHPNEAGYLAYYCDPIENWLKRL